MAQISTINLDFNVCLGKQQADLLELISARGPEIICVQEARDTNLSKILPATYATNQVMTNEGTRGSAVIWKRSAFTPNNSKLILGVNASGMHPRYMSMQTLTHSSGNKIRVVSLHLPPDRFGAAQSVMAGNVIAMVKEFEINRFIIGGDWNYRLTNDPFGIKRKTGLVSRGTGIDGFYSTTTLSPGSPITGPRINSDHTPITVNITIG